MQTNPNSKKYGILNRIGDAYICKFRYRKDVANDIVLFLLRNGIHHNLILARNSTIIDVIVPSTYHLNQLMIIPRVHHINRIQQEIKNLKNI